MAFKRPFGEIGDDDNNGSRYLKRQQQQRHHQRLNPHGNSIAVMEQIEFLKEYVAAQMETSIQSIRQRAKLSQTRSFHLKFRSTLPPRLFTGNPIEADGEGDKHVKIVLLDSNSGDVVQHGPLSSIKIELVVLDGDFEAEGKEDWMEEEFSNKVLHERKGRRPLLVGDCVIPMTRGVATIYNVQVTDNSSWVRTKRFRLGARVANGVFVEAGIREAVSNPFEVKDRRGESYQKHSKPSLHDDVWRLNMIRKDGPYNRRLAENGIHTVKDFLRQYNINQSFLHKILRASNKSWEAIVKHATSCTLDDDQCFAYWCEAEGIGLLFNCVWMVIGVTFDGNWYQTPDKISKYQKVEKARQMASENPS
ncbi:hypothetical protein Ancab_024256 [Ancistrocladus abbreviatus]